MKQLSQIKIFNLQQFKVNLELLVNFIVIEPFGVTSEKHMSKLISGLLVVFFVEVTSF